MSTIVKYVVKHTYKPLLEKYLSSTRTYRHNGFRLEIPPQVFHPGFFFSTKYLLKYIGQFDLTGKTVLELGAGSGLIAMHAAKHGANVTATDLNHTAIEYLNKNAHENGIRMKVIESDLFNDLPPQQFDFIIINPPYYKQDAITEQELAWFCGRKGEFFLRLFEGIHHYMHDQTEVLMVLCDGCDLRMIQRMANKNGFALDCVNSKRNLVERNYIFKFKRRVALKGSAQEMINDPFVQCYVDLRKSENRVYSDEELALLPALNQSHPHAEEWAVRKASSIEFSVFLRMMDRDLNILEVGCGNGWLSNKLADLPKTTVTGIDINHVELEQATRVFGGKHYLKFLHGDLREGILKDELFDIVVFAASIQYFDNLEEIIDVALRHLKPGGSIHILDSHFYNESKVASAGKRSDRYFKKAGCPEMSAYYFHHSYQPLKKYKHQLLFDPEKSGGPGHWPKVFPWIKIDA